MKGEANRNTYRYILCIYISGMPFLCQHVTLKRSHISCHIWMLCWEKNVSTTSLSPVPSFHAREFKITWISGFFIKGSKKPAILQNDRIVLAYYNFRVELPFFLLLQYENAECIAEKILLHDKSVDSTQPHKSYKEKEGILGLVPRTKSLFYWTWWQNSCRLNMTSLGPLTWWAFCSNHGVTCPTSFQKIHALFSKL